MRVEVTATEAASEFDVAIVGAGIAGCTAARLYARLGARVALIERRPDPHAYKVACTHAILPPATPIIERLGLADPLAAAGVPRTWAEFWTPYGGWFGLPHVRGWGVSRKTLDPLIRELAIDTPGVDYLGGWSIESVDLDDGRPGAVTVKDRGGRRRRIRARLLLGADGRSSAVARLTGIPGRVLPHNRFFYFAYWRGIAPPGGAAGPSIRLWLLDPEGASQFPNEDDQTVLVAVYPRERMREVRSDPERSYTETLAGLPDGPALADAERSSKLIGKLEVPNVLRLGGRPGLAFVGDAVLASDPTFGTGISTAMRTAQWLVDATASQLDHPPGLDRGLRRYRRKVLWRLAPHHLQMAEFSTGRRTRAIERLAFRRASADPETARALGEVLAREASVLRPLEPHLLGGMLRQGFATAVGRGT
jgi:2-polyprenyl-6-methoxyphenol hydroxylase-like FAD-dependent oxidoreductase